MSASQQLTLYTPTLPIKTLEQFLIETEGLFDNITGPWSPLLFEIGDRKPLEDAWTELKPNMDSVRSELNTVQASELQQAGLAGTQLKSKLGWVTSAWERFVNFGTLKLLRKLLAWINSLLGSIAMVIPGGEAIKEMKEAIERLTKGDEV